MYIADNCPKGKGKVLIDMFDEEDVLAGKRKPDDKQARCSYYRRHKCTPDECIYHPKHGAPLQKHPHNKAHRP
jgi:hypothetical protein